MVKQVKILKGVQLDEIEADINYWLARRWTLQGNLVVVSDRDGCNYFYQMIVEDVDYRGVAGAPG